MMFHILNYEKIDLTNFHTDTTNFSVWGDYNIGESELVESTLGEPFVQINPSHLKDRRWYLKCFILDLISNTQSNSLFMKIFSDNISDQQTLKEVMV